MLIHCPPMTRSLAVLKHVNMFKVFNGLISNNCSLLVNFSSPLFVLCNTRSLNTCFRPPSAPFQMHARQAGSDNFALFHNLISDRSHKDLITTFKLVQRAPYWSLNQLLSWDINQALSFYHIKSIDDHFLKTPIQRLDWCRHKSAVKLNAAAVPSGKVSAAVRKW